MGEHIDETLLNTVTEALLKSPSYGGDPLSSLLEKGVAKTSPFPESGREKVVHETARRAAKAAIEAVRRWEESKGLATIETTRLINL